MESGGMLKSDVLNSKEQALVKRGLIGYIDILSRYGFSSAEEVWSTYQRMKAARNCGSVPGIVQQPQA
jgi:hypothetical protein